MTENMSMTIWSIIFTLFAYVNVSTLSGQNYESQGVGPHNNEGINKLINKMHANFGNIKNGSLLCPDKCSCFLNNDKTEIIKVSCINQELTNIPDLPLSVKEVYLNRNKISHIDGEDFMQCKQIVILDLSQNSFTTINQIYFVNLQFLQKLDLSGNSISKLKLNTFKYLYSLQNLVLNNNQVIFNISPFAFNALKSLKSLSIQGSKLKILRNNTFNGLKNLTSLHLENNQLTYNQETFQPKSFYGLRNLKFLNIGGNTNPENIISNGSRSSQFGRNRNISISLRNGKGKLSPEANNIATTKNIYLDLTYPDKALSVLSSLETLIIDGIYLPTLGSGFSKLISLKSLKFGGFCEINELNYTFFQFIRTKNLINITLSGCSITKIHKDTFKYIPRIYMLDVSGNYDLHLDGWSEAIKGLHESNITVLMASHMISRSERLSELTIQDIWPLRQTSLKYLDLSRNNIYKLHTFIFWVLPWSLEYLDISGNNIQFPSSLVFIPLMVNLRYFDISHQIIYKVQKYQNNSMISNFVIPQKGIKHELSKLIQKIKSMPYLLKFITEKTRNRKTIKEIIESKYLLKFVPQKITNFNIIFPLPCPPNLETVLGSDVNLRYPIPYLECATNSSIKRLEFANNRANIWNGPIKNMPIEYLDLSLNYCRKANLDFFKYLPTIKTLIVFSNSLGIVIRDDPKGILFKGLKNVEVLDLRYNIISILHKNTFIYNLQLRNLSLGGNFIFKFIPSIILLSHLNFLNLSENRLTGLTERTTNEMIQLKEHNEMLIVDVSMNELECSCDYKEFSMSVCQYPRMYKSPSLLKFRYQGNVVDIPTMCVISNNLLHSCTTQGTFIATLVTFAVILSCVIIACILYYYRWRLKFLYYIGKQRLHIGQWSSLIGKEMSADVLCVFDTDEPYIRQLVQEKFLPVIRGNSLTTIVGEADFPAGNELTFISQSVSSCKKMLVLLSRGIFLDYKAEFEMNMAIMYELYLRSPYVVPVLLDTDLNETTDVYPREISSFLDSQHNRCLVFRDSQSFWRDMLQQLTPEV